MKIGKLEMTKTLMAVIGGGIISLILAVVLIIAFLATRPNVREIILEQSSAPVVQFENPSLIEKLDELKEFSKLPIRVNKSELGRPNPFLKINK